MRIEPWTSIGSCVPAGRVQAVDVLRDHARHQPAPLELGDREVRAVGPLAVEEREALPVEGPEALGSRRQTEMCATSIGSTFAHSPVIGVRKSGIPEGTEIPAPGQHHDRPGAPDQLREALRRVTCP